MSHINSLTDAYLWPDTFTVYEYFSPNDPTKVEVWARCNTHKHFAEKFSYYDVTVNPSTIIERMRQCPGCVNDRRYGKNGEFTRHPLDPAYEAE